MKLLIVAAALLLALAPSAYAMTVRAVAQDVNFTDTADLVVEVEAAGSQGLVGLQFSVVYPSGLLAVDQPVSVELGSMTSHGFVNPDADSSDLPAGFRRIGVSFAASTPVAATSGRLLTVSFPLRCSEFSGEWPLGRPVAIDIQDEKAWTATGSELPVAVPVVAEDVTVTVDCTTVPASSRGFSTLKAQHRTSGGAR